MAYGVAVLLLAQAVQQVPVAIAARRRAITLIATGVLTVHLAQAQ